MAEEQIQVKDIQQVILPRFKDKVMFVPASNSRTKSDTSYVISSSFKGIVRLSPNNHNTTYERATYQLSLADNKNAGTTYSDAIKFDNEVETAINSEADITKRMIIGSDSDGYLVGFRISQDNFEFDNLGVIGILEANHLSIISPAQSSHEDVLILNGERMPHVPNRIQEALNIETFEKTFDKETGEVSYVEAQPYDFHTKEVKITGQGDKSFLLVSQVTADGKKFYKYQRTNYLIRELILEALMDFQTIPTGSIHWFPVTIEQFQELVRDNGNKPNVSFIPGTSEQEKVDPLLRDFLLCDGRRYNNKDFPELAKILWKEPIRRWRKTRDIHSGAEYMLPLWDTQCNNYGEKEKSTIIDGNGNLLIEMDYTFRVPDLRHQFICSTYTDGSFNVATGAASDGIKGTRNKVGAWSPDKTPPSSMENRIDNHAHFVAYGSYGENFHVKNKRREVKIKLPLVGRIIKIVEGGYASLETGKTKYGTDKPIWDSVTIEKDISFNKDLSKLHTLESSQPHVMLLHNHPYKMKLDGGGSDNFRGFGWRYNTPSDNIHSGIDSIPATMWLSRPKISHVDTDINGFEEWRQNTVVKGKSSPDVTAAVRPKSYKDIDQEFEETEDKNPTKWGEEYAPWGDYQTDLYGHESTPKYYAMLPFIKI